MIKWKITTVLFGAIFNSLNKKKLVSSFGTAFAVVQYGYQ